MTCASPQLALAYLKLMHEGWTYGRKTYGNPYDRHLLRLALIGWLESKPFDESDLALELGISRRQVMRRIITLRNRGLLIPRRDRNRILILPTEPFIDRALVEITHRIGRKAKHWATIVPRVKGCCAPLLGVALSVLGIKTPPIATTPTPIVTKLPPAAAVPVPPTGA